MISSGWVVTQRTNGSGGPCVMPTAPTKWHVKFPGAIARAPALRPARTSQIGRYLHRLGHFRFKFGHIFHSTTSPVACPSYVFRVNTSTNTCASHLAQRCCVPAIGHGASEFMKGPLLGSLSLPNTAPDPHFFPVVNRGGRHSAVSSQFMHNKYREI